MSASSVLQLLLLGVVMLTSTASASPTQSTAGIPLFLWESEQLTSNRLAELKENDVIGQHGRVFENALDTSVPKPPSGFCKAFPGDASWPDPKLWEALGVALGEGALIANKPIGAVCYKNSEVHDEGRCQELLKVFPRPRTQYVNPFFTLGWSVGNS